MLFEPEDGDLTPVPQVASKLPLQQNLAYPSPAVSAMTSKDMPFEKASRNLDEMQKPKTHESSIAFA